VTGLSPTFSSVTDGTNITPSYVTGLYGQAVYFNNKINFDYTTANSYIIYNVSPSLSITSNNSTYSFWINPRYANLPSLSSLRAGTNNILQIIDSSTSYRFLTNGYANGNGVFFQGGTNSGTVYSSTLQAYTTGKWCHLAVTLSNIGQSSGSTLSSFYFNGIFQGSSTHTVGTNGNVSSILLAAQANGGTQGVMGGYFYIQDLRIYNTALTAAQVLGIYQSQGIPPRATLTQSPAYSTGTSNLTSNVQPSLLWSFNGSTTDSIQGLTMTGGTPVYAPALYGQGLSVSTTSFTNNLPAASNITTVKGLTVSCWINQTAGDVIRPDIKLTILNLGTPVKNNNQSSLPSGAYTNSNPLELILFFSNGKLAYVYNDYGAGYREYDSTKVPSLNTWYHMCVVVGGGASPGSTSNTLSFYINGVLDNTTGYTTDMSGTMAYNYVSTTYLTNNTFVINDARVYNTALTDTQVLGIYKSKGIPPRASLP
jgi:hypothetical protein